MCLNELILRRHMCLDQQEFDRTRYLWRRDMFRKAVKRDGHGRFSR